MPQDSIEFHDLESVLKVLIVGSGGVGKSSLIRRFTRGQFNPTYKKTVGVDYAERIVPTSSGDVRLMLWDTAGQEEFDQMAQKYYDGAHAVIFAFSITDRGSFEAIKNWKKKVDSVVSSISQQGSASGDGVARILVMNKVDEAPTLFDNGSLVPSNVKSSPSVSPYSDHITLAEARHLALSLDLDLFPVSVKTGKGVDQVFMELADRYMHKKQEIPAFSSQINLTFLSENQGTTRSTLAAAGEGSALNSPSTPNPQNTQVQADGKRNPAIVSSQNSSLSQPALHPNIVSQKKTVPHLSAPLVFNSSSLEKEMKNKRCDIERRMKTSTGSKECVVM